MEDSKEILFQEKQRFSQAWLWVILGVIWGVLLYSLYTVILTYGLNGMTVVWNGVGVFVLLLVTILALEIQLKTAVFSDRIEIRFKPFVYRKEVFHKKDIQQLTLLQYDPLKNYGGWGLRLSPTYGKAYTVKGTNGLMIQLKTGRKLLIGTQQPEQMEKALADYPLKIQA